MAKKSKLFEQKPEEERTFFFEEPETKKLQGTIIHILEKRMVIEGDDGNGYEAPVDPTKKVGDRIDVK